MTLIPSVERDFDLFHTREGILGEARKSRAGKFEKWDDGE